MGIKDYKSQMTFNQILLIFKKTIMSVKFKTREMGNPQSPEDQKKHYVQVINGGNVTLRQLSRDIAAHSTWSSSETYGMLEELLQRIGRYVSDGMTVRLGDMGSFSISVKSSGSTTSAEVTSHNVLSRKLLFRPGKEMKRILSEITFEKK